MQFKKTHNFISAVLRIALLTILFVLGVFSQVSEKERPRIKDFGKSLRQEKIEKSEATNIPADSDEDVIKVETNLVRTDILVVDQKGNGILGLHASDFIVTENDIPQEVGTFSLGDSQEVPRSIVLIIDYSYSQLPYIKNSVEAAKVLVDKLNPKDRMAIVTDNVELLVQFTTDKKLLKETLDSLLGKVNAGDRGRSLQYSALIASLNELFDDEDIRPIIVFQTDGDQFLDIKPETPQPGRFRSANETTFTDKEMIETVQRSRAIIFSVVSGVGIVGLTPENALRKIANVDEKTKDFKPAPALAQYGRKIFAQQKAMEVIARTSGGFTELLETPDQANAVYSRILRGINYRYLIGYYPTDSEQTGKRRNVKIEVRGHPEYIVWGRKFYYAPIDRKTKNN